MYKFISYSYLLYITQARRQYELGR